MYQDLEWLSLVITLLFLSGCSPHFSSFPTPTIVSTITPVPSATPRITISRIPLMITSRPSITPFPIPPPLPTATLASSSYQPKQPVIIFGKYGILSAFPEFVGGMDIQLVLYTDGQLLIKRTGSPMEDTTLSSREMCDFLGKIKQTGFFDLESTGDAYKDSALYHIDQPIERVYDSLEFDILVNGQPANKLWLYQPLIKYLIPQAREILSLLSNYQPKDLHSYHPERYLIWIAMGDATSDFGVTRQPISWPSELPSLNDMILVNGQTRAYFEKDDAKTINKLFPNWINLVIDGDSEYTVAVFPLLPHQLPEKLDNLEDLSESPLPFKCN
jgi:hypothetical protein